MAAVVDTNVLIRYVTNDDPAKAEKARSFFELVAQGGEECVVCESVLAEVIWVLTHPRTYALTRVEVVEFLGSFLLLEQVSITPKALYIRALEMYQTSRLDFPDCVLASLVERNQDLSLITFDTEIAEVFSLRVRVL